MVVFKKKIVLFVYQMKMCNDETHNFISFR